VATEARFAELGVATTLEAAGGDGLLAGSFVRVVPGSRAAGPARTALCGAADNLAAHRALERVEPGDVLVLAVTEPRPGAVIGDLIAMQAKARGAAAILIDGPVRDVDALVELGIPVWARSISAAGPAKKVPGDLDVPVDLGGVRIAPGDIVILDGDGVVVVPRENRDAVLAAAEAREAKERDLIPRLEAGELTLDLMGLRRLNRL
jgi:4-hydroxy-4-methyl-2-oxoglutarate aldolase